MRPRSSSVASAAAAATPASNVAKQRRRNLIDTRMVAPPREIFNRTRLPWPGTRRYMFKRRGIFKTSAARRRDYSFSKEAVAEIEHNFEALKPYLKL